MFILKLHVTCIYRLHTCNLENISRLQVAKKGFVVVVVLVLHCDIMFNHVYWLHFILIVHFRHSTNYK